MFKILRKRFELVCKDSVAKIFRVLVRGDNWHNFDFEKYNLGFGWIYYGLIRNLKPKKVLCIGSRWGFVPAICAMGCRDNGFGVVDFVDAGFSQENESQGNHWGGMGWWKVCNKDAYFGKFDIEDYIRLHVVTTEKFLEEEAGKNIRYEYIFIDGDHSYEGVKYDYENFWPRLKKGGVMLIHDINTKDLGGLKYGVGRLWKEIKESRVGQAFEFEGECGVGIIRK